MHSHSMMVQEDAKWEALNAWKENGCQELFAMETSTDKTIIALNRYLHITLDVDAEDVQELFELEQELKKR